MLQVSSVSFFSLSMNTRYASSVAFAAKIVEQRNIEEFSFCGYLDIFDFFRAARSHNPQYKIILQE